MFFAFPVFLPEVFEVGVGVVIPWLFRCTPRSDGFNSAAQRTLLGQMISVSVSMFHCNTVNYLVDGLIDNVLHTLQYIAVTMRFIEVDRSIL